jgi:hypothetical protein
MTNEAELLFIPKEVFASLETNQDIKEKILVIFEEKNKVLSHKIEKYKEIFELEFDKFLQTKEKEESNYRKIKHKIIPFENKTDITPFIIKNQRRKINNSQNKKNYLIKSNSETNLYNYKLFSNNNEINQDQADLRNYIISNKGNCHNRNITTMLQNYNNDRYSNIEIYKEQPIISLKKINNTNKIESSTNINKIIVIIYQELFIVNLLTFIIAILIIVIIITTVILVIIRIKKEIG